MKKVAENIEDGDLQRNEDIVIAELVKQSGGKYVKVKDSIHYHQVVEKNGNQEPKIESISIKRESDISWEIKNNFIQIKGIIKNLQPRKYLVLEVKRSILMLKILGAYDNEMIAQFIKMKEVWKEFTNVKI